MSLKLKSKAEQLVNKSAAEFFAEHQQIAGFDNPGKSLFTAIRELVENSLDAAESINVLPDVSVTIVERTQAEHNLLHGIHKRSIIDALSSTTTTAENPSSSSKSEMMYYSITVKDNGSGIASENIGNMLGRVLSGSKHGIRQTRGKFGLGAKMALIWSKKSSGLPIMIKSAYSLDADTSPSPITDVTLDIDIYKNAPTILHQANMMNVDGWRGTEISLTIGGHWSTYRAKMLQYFQQLAVITPYAHIDFAFQCIRDEKRSITLSFERRSDTMPAIPGEMLPHPRSLNHITLTNLLQKSSNNSLVKFLTKDLCGISSSAAASIISSIQGLSDETSPASISANKIAALCQILHRDDASLIKPPSASGLSPAGSYNLRLGVMKELQPKLVATFADKPSSHEGHPFIVEGAVSVGGTQLREGINVYRFANRIPLLFETGADVVTQVSTKRINWSSYHIDPKKDNIGVFISIVSTKIPFKGTSKEYIGDDIVEIQQSVKRVIQGEMTIIDVDYVDNQLDDAGCCQQLRAGLAKSIALREEQERKKTLVRYIPDIARSLASILKTTVAKRKLSSSSSSVASSLPPPLPSSSSSESDRHIKRQRLINDADNGRLSEDTISSKLRAAVDKHDADMMIQSAISITTDRLSRPTQPLYLLPSSCNDHPVPRWKDAIISASTRATISNVSYDSTDQTKIMNSSLVSMDDAVIGISVDNDVYWKDDDDENRVTPLPQPAPVNSSQWLQIISAKHMLILVPDLDGREISDHRSIVAPSQLHRSLIQSSM